MRRLSAVYIGSTAVVAVGALKIAGLLPHVGKAGFWSFLLVGSGLLASGWLLRVANIKALPTSERAGWVMIAMALLANSMGDAIWSFLEGRFGVSPVTAAFSGPAYLLYYPLWLAGVLKIARPRTKHQLGRAVFAATVGVLGIAAVLYRHVFQPLLALPLANPDFGWATMGFPVGDLLILTGSFALLWCHYAERRPMGLPAMFLTSAVVMTIGDVWYSYSFTRGEYSTGMPLDLAFVVAVALTAVAGAERLRSVDTPQVASAEPADVAFWFGPPILSALAILSLMITDLATLGAISPAVAVFGMALVVLGGVHRTHCLLQQRRTIENHLRSFAERLENDVEAKTEQVRGLLAATGAIHASLERDEILRASLNQTMGLLGGQGAFIWWPPSREDNPETANLIWQYIGPSQTEFRILNFVGNRPFNAGPLSCAVNENVETQHLLACLLTYKGEPKGWIGVLRSSAPFTAEDQEILSSIGATAGLAVANALMHKQAQEMSERDLVTGLMNSRAMHAKLSREIQESSAAEQEVSVLLLDLANFRLFNATYGLPNGDAILRRVGQVLTVNCPSDCWVGRFGGDEFLVVAPNIKSQQAIVLAEQLVAALELEGFSVPGDDLVVPVKSQVGIATAPEDATTLHGLLSVASRNLSLAKRSDEKVGSTSDAQRENRKLNSNTSFAALDALVTAVDNKDAYTRRHSEEVAEYSLWMAEDMGCSDETLKLVRMAALLHDVGKIGVPTQILVKPGRLNDDEFRAMERHASIGGLLVEAFQGMENLLEGIRSHHEHWNGMGYPDGLKGNDIPWLGRLLAVADAYSAMTSDRPYRKGLGASEAVRRLVQGAGSQFDPYMVDTFVKGLAKRGIPGAEVHNYPKAA